MSIGEHLTVGDIFHAAMPEDYLPPYIVDLYSPSAILKKSVPVISYSMCVMFVSKSYIFYNAVTVYKNGLTRCEVMQRMNRSDLNLDLRTGHLKMTKCPFPQEH